VPPSKAQLYDLARSQLDGAWSLIGTEDAPSFEGLNEATLADVQAVIGGRDLAPRYALITQTLVKLVLPDESPTRLSGFVDAPSGFSSRSLAKNAVVPFDVAHDSLLGGSGDPYVSNPLRREEIDESLADDDPGGQWEALLRVLQQVEQTPGLAQAVLVCALAAAQARQLTLALLLERGMELQARRKAGEDVTDERNELIEKRSPAFLRKLLPPGLQADGGAQTGSEAEVPWVRVFSPERAPSAQEGWYAVYLFSADGSAAFLALMQGVTHAGASAMVAGEQWAREIVKEQPDFSDQVELASEQPPGSRPDRYEKAAVYAKKYNKGSLSAEHDLRHDLQMIINMLEAIYEAEGVAEPPLHDDMSALDVQTVLEVAAESQLTVDEALIGSAVAALRAGKHVLLTGAPGTGKTSFAQVLASAAERSRLCRGAVLATGTSDWTSADTVGGYWPSRADTSKLVFRPGQFLEAIDRKQWIIVDELNRADIDKAIGQLFTVLSGQAVTLPFEEEFEDAHLPVSIVPPGAEAPPGTSPHRIVAQWRMIATLNTRDRDLLFTLSYALLRRFAVIDVPIPSKDAFLEILKEKGDTGSPEANARIIALIDLPHRPLGPAILIDVGKYVRERISVGESDVDRAVAEAVAAFVLPQLDDLRRPQQVAVVTFTKEHVLKGWTPAQVAALFADTFHAAREDLVAEASSGIPESQEPNAEDAG
jgi:MoxR-like ATPase